MYTHTRVGLNSGRKRQYHWCVFMFLNGEKKEKKKKDRPENWCQTMKLDFLVGKTSFDS